MTTALIIAARELRERKFVFITAAVLATIPFVTALLPFSRRFGMAASIVGSGPILAAVFTIAVAAGLGSSMVARELGERRLSFYFARPVSATALWFGKLAGAAVATALSFAIIAVPAFIAGRQAWNTTWAVGVMDMTGAVLVAGIFLLLISHALNTMIRSRSAVLLIDLVLIAAFVFVAGLLLLPLFESMALQLVRTVATLIAAVLFLALVAAGAWQMSRGRTEIRRSHAEMSKFLWIAVSAGLLVIGSYVAWVLAADPEDLEIAYADQNARGTWAAVGGFSKGRSDYFPIFLINPGTGESVKFPAGRWSQPKFARAGNAVYGEIPPFPVRGTASNFVVAVYRFGVDDRPLPVELRTYGWVVLSDDAKRMAVLDGRTVSIRDIDADRLVASAALRASRGVNAFFVSPDLLRIIVDDKKELAIHELNATTRTLTRTGTWTKTSPNTHVRATDDGSMLLVTSWGDGKAQPVLLDGRSAAVRATLDIDDATLTTTRFLSDGRVAAVTGAPDRVLALFAPDGSLVKQIPIGKMQRPWLDGETSSGKIVVSGTVVDLQRGTVVRREPQLRVMSSSWWSTDPRVPVPNETGEFIVRDGDGKTMLWNVETGEKNPLI